MDVHRDDVLSRGVSLSLHKGYVLATGVLTDPTTLGLDATRMRLLRMVEEGDVVVSAGRFVGLRFGTPRWMNGDGPFVVLTGTDPMVAGPGAPQAAADVQMLWGGEWVALRARPVDLTEWIESSEPARTGRPLTVLPTLKSSLADPFQPSMLGVEPRDEVQGLLSSLKQSPRSAPQTPEPSPAADRPSASSAAEAGWAVRLARWLGLASSPEDVVAPPPPGEWEDEQRALQMMLDRFQSGDVEEALRWAIPLGGQAGVRSSHPAFQAFRAFRREELDAAAPQSGGSGGVVDTGPRLFGSIQEAYERAANDLIDQDEIEQAAFVYNQLLGDRHRALALLEEYERYELAARLAETFRPAAAVRFWSLAGDVEQALRVAWLHNCFNAALLQFDGEEQTWIRSAWSARLIRSGRLEAAVDVVWPDPILRVTAAPWLADLVRSGGHGVGRNLARWGMLDAQRARPYFEQRLTSEEVADRIELIQTDLPSSWRRPLMRRLIADSGAVGFDVQRVKRLLSHVDLVDLRRDAPRLSQGAEPPLPNRVFAAHHGLADPVLGAVFSSFGVLLAHGDGGFTLRELSGEVRFRRYVPIHSWVEIPGGHVALGLQGVGVSEYRVWQIDLRDGSSREWGHLSLDAWSPCASNGLWTVAHEGRIRVLDLGEEGLPWLAESQRLVGTVTQIQHQAGIRWLEDRDGVAWWGRATDLLNHARTEACATGTRPLCLVPNGVVGVLDGHLTSIPGYRGPSDCPSRPLVGESMGVSTLVAYQDDADIVVVSHSHDERRDFAWLCGASTVQFVRCGPTITAFDDRGHVIRFRDQQPPLVLGRSGR